MSETKPKSGYLRQAWLVILLALVYGAALAGIQRGLGPRIEENKRRETYRVIPQIVPGANEAATVERQVDGEDGQPHRVFEARSDDGRLIGFVLPASGLGFADRIDLLVGLDAELKTITGMYVLDQKETPGLGNLITDQPFREQFAGKSAQAPLVVIKTDPLPERNEIRAVTGATISSQSVAEIVNHAIENLRPALKN